jgi:hypothetical protein
VRKAKQELKMDIGPFTILASVIRELDAMRINISWQKLQSTQILL